MSYYYSSTFNSLSKSYEALDIDSLVADIDIEDLSSNEGYLGMGGDFSAVRIEHAMGPLVMRFPQQPEEGYYTPQDAFERRVRALVRGLGSRALEQVVAVQPQKFRVVTRFVTDKFLPDLTAEDIATISQSTFRDVKDTFSDMARRGLEIDPDLDHFAYGPERGLFSFIDYQEPPYGRTTPMSPEEQYAAFAHQLEDLAFSVHQGDHKWVLLAHAAKQV